MTPGFGEPASVTAHFDVIAISFNSLFTKSRGAHLPVMFQKGGCALPPEKRDFKCRNSSGVDVAATVPRGSGKKRDNVKPSFGFRASQPTPSFFWWFGLSIILLVLGCSRAPHASPSVSTSADGWHQFEGTWTAAGSRNIMSMGRNRHAAVSTLEGSLVLAASSGVGVGFQSQALIFNDSATGLVGRAVWTDERGDQVFSELRGEGAAEGNKITGTFVGGSGRYSGATGAYAFSWRFEIENEDGVVEGQSVGLNGRVRLGSPQTEPGPGGPKS